MTRRRLTALAIGIIFTSTLPNTSFAAGVHSWSRRLGGTSTDVALSMTRDPAGSLVVAGYTTSPTIDLGGGPLPGAGSDDIVLAKVSSAGSHTWSKRLGGSSFDLAYSVASDGDGNVLLAGYTRSDSIDMGGGGLSGPGSDDIVLAKYSSDGVHLWSKRMGGATFDYALAVSTDESGAVLLAGYSSSPTVDLGGGPIAGAGVADFVLAKYSPSGDHIWSRRLGGNSQDFAVAVAGDADGSVLVAGYSSSTSIDLGGGPMAGAGNDDLVLAKFSAGGAHLWSRRFGGSGVDQARSVAADPAGNVLLAGSSASATIDLGGGPLSGSGIDDVLVAKFSASGAHLWSKRLGGTSNDFGNSVASDHAGNVLLAGAVFSPTVDLGAGPLAGPGNYDIVAARYSPAGAHLWSKRIGGSGDDVGRSVTADPAGNLMLAGAASSSSIDFGGGPLFLLGGFDLVVARFAFDTSPPLIDPTLLPPPNDDGWHNDDVTLTWNVSDPESSVASTTGCAVFAQTAQTAGTSVTCAATNEDGFTSSQTVTVRLDRTAPAATVTPAVALVRALGHTLAGAAVDNLSGVASVMVTLVDAFTNTTSLPASCTGGCGTVAATWSLALPDSLLPGLYVVTASSTDRAGNTGPSSAPVQVIVV